MVITELLIIKMSRVGTFQPEAIFKSRQEGPAKRGGGRWINSSKGSSEAFAPSLWWLSSRFCSRRDSIARSATIH